MALEKIASNSLFKDIKKRYTMAVLYNEGTWYKDKPKISTTGLESISSSTPQFARTFLDEVYEYILNSDDNLGLKSILERQEKEFYQMDIDDIADVVSINKGIDNIKNIDSNKNELLGSDNVKFEKGARSGLKAAHIHNMYNKKHGYHLKPIDTNGVKFKVVPLKVPNTISSDNPTIAYVGSFPAEWREDVYDQIDRTAIWKNRYLKTIDNFTNVLKYYYQTKNIDYDFF